MKKGNQILDYFKEVTIVVIGVLIAVSIGNYKERLDDETYLKKTLGSIEKEILSSQAEIDTVLDRHIALFRKLEGGLVENEQTIVEIVSSSGGFQVASIKNISLRFFISNKAELLDFEIISQLLDIELKTKSLSEKINRLTAFVYDNLHKNDKEVTLQFRYLLADVIDGEQTIVDSYTNFLSDHKEYLRDRGK